LIHPKCAPEIDVERRKEEGAEARRKQRVVDQVQLLQDEVEPVLGAPPTPQRLVGKACAQQRNARGGGGGALSGREGFGGQGFVGLVKPGVDWKKEREREREREK
jgi:hypothetical protein